MAVRVIVGAGQTGVVAARLLADRGDTVRLVTRKGSGPDHPLVERIALDANETDRLAELAAGAKTVFNAAMPAYHTWPQTIPPLFGSIQSAAERSGADYVMLGNLYGYGPHEGVLTEDHPLEAQGPKGTVRARMWLEAKAAHDAGRVRVTEVRAGDYIGREASSLFHMLTQPKVVAGRLGLTVGDPDMTHAFTFIDDAARALVTLADDERSFGRAWHAPILAVTIRDAANRLAELVGAPKPTLAQLTERDFAVLELADPLWGEMDETAYMGDHPYLVDDSAIRDTFGVKAAPLDEVLLSSPNVRPAG